MFETPEYTPEEIQRVNENLVALLAAIGEGRFADDLCSIGLLRAMHATTFRGVRSHAGRHRDRGFGQEYITFGTPRRRSAHRNDVARRLEALAAQTRREVSALLEASESDDYDLRAIRLAVRAHAELLDIHPFEDGNGRTSRALLSHLLVTLGLRPFAPEFPRGEYLEALHAWDDRRELDPLVDLVIQVSAAQIPPG